MLGLERRLRLLLAVFVPRTGVDFHLRHVAKKREGLTHLGSYRAGERKGFVDLD